MCNLQLSAANVCPRKPVLHKVNKNELLSPQLHKIIIKSYFGNTEPDVSWPGGLQPLMHHILYLWKTIQITIFSVINIYMYVFSLKSTCKCLVFITSLYYYILCHKNFSLLIINSLYLWIFNWLSNWPALHTELMAENFSSIKSVGYSNDSLMGCAARGLKPLPIPKNFSP